VSRILTPHFDVVAAVHDGKAALDAAARTNPDLVPSDIMMPEVDRFRVARQPKERDSRAKVVLLTGQDDDDYVSEALIVGARGLVVKRRMPLDLVPAWNLAAAGQYFISPQASGYPTYRDLS
jgi:DNA-binding NarL/FixJ family response regulator